MSELSDPTLAVLIEAGQKLRGSDLTTMLMRAGIYEYSPRKTGIQSENKAELIRSRLLAAQGAAQEGDTAARRGLLAFATDLFSGQSPIRNTRPPGPASCAMPCSLTAMNSPGRATRHAMSP